jgi:hypothetical protein
MDWDNIRVGTEEAQFRLKASFPLSWKIVASELFNAANVLSQRVVDAHKKHIGLLETHSLNRNANTTASSRPRPLSEEEMQIHQDLALGRIAVMLIGMGIEALAKGFLFCSRPDEFFDFDAGPRRKPRTNRKVAKGRQLRNHTVLNHDLVALIRECGIEVSGELERDLAMTAAAVKWQARYAIPLEADTVFVEVSGKAERAHSDFNLLLRGNLNFVVEQLWGKINALPRTPK